MKTVLIVEDEILARLGLRQLLEWEKLGFILLEDVSDGEAAIKSICNYRRSENLRIYSREGD